MSKIDYKKEYGTLYRAKAEPDLLEVPPLAYLMIDGEGDPNTAQAYADAVSTLFTLSYTLKFYLKKMPGGPDYGVMPLEGLWWAEPMETFSVERKDDWKWTSLILQPEPVTREHVESAMKQAAAKEPPSLHLVRYEQLHEGKSAQILHVGPYSEEAPAIQRLHAFIREQGLELAGKHHEIYLNDPRRTAPERLRTIIRQPVK